MKKILLIVTAIALFLTGCAGSGSGAKEQTFEEWQAADISYPDWAEAVDYTLEADNPYGPRGGRMSYTLEEAKQSFKETRYLVENYEFSDDYPMYNRWKFNLANDALVFGQPHIAYKIASDFVDLPEGTVVMKYKRGDNVIEYKIDDHGLREHIRVIIFRAMVQAGHQTEAKAYFQEHNLIEAHDDHAALAMALVDLDMIDQAKTLINKGLVLENLEDHGHMIATNVLGAAAFYYELGEYNKVVEISDIVLKEGIDSTNPEIFGDRDRTEGYYNNHWSSSYMLVEKYKQLAKRALEGEVVDFSKMKNGTYTAINTGYMLTPIAVDMTVKDGKIETISSSQEDPKDDRSYTATETIPNQIIETQAVKVDTISSATISSESMKISIIEAILEAMK